MVKKYGNYDKYPTKEITGYKAWRGYPEISEELKKRVAGRKKTVIVLETYTEVNVAEILEGLKGVYDTAFNAEDCTMSDEAYNARIKEFVTDDRVFGIMNTLNVQDVYLPEKIGEMRAEIEKADGVILVSAWGLRWCAKAIFSCMPILPAGKFNSVSRRGRRTGKRTIPPLRNWRNSNRDFSWSGVWRTG